MEKKHLIYYSDTREDAKNCRYGKSVSLSEPEKLKEAFKHDYVTAKYKNAYRSNDNFDSADVIAFDIDNDGEDPAAWISAEDMEAMLPDVRYVIAFSRHHMKPKNGKAARPRFHILFPIDEIRDRDEYETMKRDFYSHFPFADRNALDAARFFFGTEDGAYIVHEGNVNIDRYLKSCEPPIMKTEKTGIVVQKYTIPVGKRNQEMHKHAVSLVVRYGPGKKAKKLFMEYAGKCEKPLDDAELCSIWESAVKFFECKVTEDKEYVRPEEYEQKEKQKEEAHEEPVAFQDTYRPPFPINALPKEFADYANAVAESTQTPVDMAGCAALGVMALCNQGRYMIIGKPDWRQPLNLYGLVVAEPSERKSPIVQLFMEPVNSYEKEYNTLHAAEFEEDQAMFRVMLKRQKMIEDNLSRGKEGYTTEDLADITGQINDFKPRMPLRLYVDDVTPEKLCRLIEDNNSTMAVVSAEGGVFGTLTGRYNADPNIDVWLKGYSGDDIRVDRSGKPSVTIYNPCLTSFLTVQPDVLSSVIGNEKLTGRGLTARFLISYPKTYIGERIFNSTPIPDGVRKAYNDKVHYMLDKPVDGEIEYIRLDDDAKEILNAYADTVEMRMKTDFLPCRSWAGKLVGAVLRIAGNLCVAAQCRVYERDPFQNNEISNPPLIVDGLTMSNAVALGEYFSWHAIGVFSGCVNDSLRAKSKMVFEKLKEKGKTSFNAREVMRICGTFRTVDEVQPVLKELEDRAYIEREKTEYKGSGRPASVKYRLNPKAA